LGSVFKSLPFCCSLSGPFGDASALSQMLAVLHARTAGWINRLDDAPGRKVWHNFWDTKLTYQKSYLARLNYVHQNAVKHGLVPVANQYPWCSARWFEGVASPAMVRSIYRFKIDALNLKDDFAPVRGRMIRIPKRRSPAALQNASEQCGPAGRGRQSGYLRHPRSWPLHPSRPASIKKVLKKVLTLKSEIQYQHDWLQSRGRIFTR
jgi:hypothetical protein